jgi:hypothetical protein
VGAYTVPEEGFIPGAQIATSKDDGSGNGFTEGHTVKFRVWKEDLETDIDADIFVFTDVISGNTVPQVFTALSGVNVEIGVQPPSSPSSFSANGNSNHVNLSWSTPSVGNYSVYTDGSPSQAIFYRLSRESVLLTEDYQSNSFTDTNLSNNTLYDYELESYSVVGAASSVFDDALTLPGTPEFTENVPDFNEVTLNWTDADDTGNDGDITYTLERQWSADEGSYSATLVSSYAEQLPSSADHWRSRVYVISPSFPVSSASVQFRVTSLKSGTFSVNSGVPGNVKASSNTLLAAPTTE